MAGIVWQREPIELAQEVANYADMLMTEAGRVVVEESIRAQTEMRERRPWGDITGNARRGLRVWTENTRPRDSQGKFMPGKQIAVYFIHSVEYGVYLELARGGTYQIIRPVMRETGERIKKRLPGSKDRMTVGEVVKR
jgi:hypothetical protein